MTNFQFHLAIYSNVQNQIVRNLFFLRVSETDNEINIYIDLGSFSLNFVLACTKDHYLWIISWEIDLIGV